MEKGGCLSDNFAPNWLPFFSPEGQALSIVEFNVECAICQKRLAITEPADESSNVEAFSILPCGHSFGQECIETWLGSGSSNGSCPSCRRSLQFSECGHHLVPRRLEFGRGVDLKRAVEQSIVDESEWPRRCPDCSVDRDGRGRRGGVDYVGPEAFRTPPRSVPRSHARDYGHSRDHGHGHRHGHGRGHHEHRFPNGPGHFFPSAGPFLHPFPPMPPFRVPPEDVAHGGFLYGPPARSASSPGYGDPWSLPASPHSSSGTRAPPLPAPLAAELAEVQAACEIELDESGFARGMSPAQRRDAVEMIMDRVLRNPGYQRHSDR